jgi:hypothetical protein
MVGNYFFLTGAFFAGTFLAGEGFLSFEVDFAGAFLGGAGFLSFEVDFAGAFLGGAGFLSLEILLEGGLAGDFEGIFLTDGFVANGFEAVARLRVELLLVLEIRLVAPVLRDALPSLPILMLDVALWSVPYLSLSLCCWTSRSFSSNFNPIAAIFSAFANLKFCSWSKTFAFLIL